MRITCNFMAFDMVYFFHLSTGHVILEVFNNSSTVRDSTADGATPGKTCGKCHESFTSATNVC
jgi:hypothetical protein